jgi:TolA-binding protein
VIACLLLAGCATAGEVADRPPMPSREVQDIKANVERLEHGLTRLEARQDDVRMEVERQAREQSAERARQTAVLTGRLETVAAGLAGVTERLDTLRATLQALEDSREQRAARDVAAEGALDALAKTLTALAERIDQLGARILAQEQAALKSAAQPAPLAAAPETTGSVSAAPAQAPPATAPPPPAVAPEPPPAGPLAAVPSRGAPPVDPRPGTEAGPLDLYQAAYLDFSRGNYALAIGGFREFLKRQPSDAAADDAQYWIGEAYFSLAQRYQDDGQSERVAQALQEAGQAFRAVAEKYPNGDKVPSALYREALVLLAQRQPVIARARLESLIERFPEASEVLAARQRLADLTKE